MEMWLRIRHGDINNMYHLESIKERKGEIIYKTTDYGTIYHTADNLYILDVAVGLPNDVSVVIMA